MCVCVCQGVAALRQQLRLHKQVKTHDWAIWASTVDDDTVGVPKIIGFPPRYNFDSFRLSMFSAVQVFFFKMYSCT